MIEDVGLPAPRELDSLLITVDEVDLSGLRAAAVGGLLETHVTRCFHPRHHSDSHSGYGYLSVNKRY